MSDRLDELDYYTLLGVSAEATADDIREAYHSFALRYHPDRHVGEEPEIVGRAAEIFRRGAEAYSVLLDPARRGRYDEGLSRGELRLASELRETQRADRPPRPGPDAIRSLKARPFAARAEQAIAARDWKQARLNLQIALQHEPGHTGLSERLAEVEARLRRSSRP